MVVYVIQLHQNTYGGVSFKFINTLMVVCIIQFHQETDGGVCIIQFHQLTDGGVHHSISSTH